MSEQEYDLKSQLIATQEMLALVLDEVGEPVVVSKERMKEGLAPNIGISVEEKDDAFIFSLSEGP